MNKKFYVLGAGGFARELYSYIASCNFRISDYVFAGFLDDNKEALNCFNISEQIIETLICNPLMLGKIQNIAFILGVGNSSLKKELYNHYTSLGCRFLTYIHPTALVGSRVRIGDGSILCPNSVVTTDVVLGVGTTINVCSTIGHDAELGDFCTLSGHCDVTGGVKLGDEVFMGTHACIAPKVIVESKAFIGAGSVVIKNVTENTTVFGNPAKKIR